MLARQLFPGGVEVRATRGLDQAIRTTRELVANREVPAIFEGVFEHGGVLVRVDILHRRRDGRWRLIEVKSTTDVKDHHLEDVAIQYRVVSRSGLDVASACLAHVNRDYVFEGGNIDRAAILQDQKPDAASPEVAAEADVPTTFGVHRARHAQGPDIAPGQHCTDPVTCEFYDRCNPPRPNDHIGFLPRIHASAMEELEELGVESIHDIPDDFDVERDSAACGYVRADRGAVVQPRTRRGVEWAEVSAVFYGL